MRCKAWSDPPLREHRKSLTLWELAYDIFVLWFWPKNSSFRLPYQRHSSSDDCARELFKDANRSASLVDCTRKKIFWLGVRIFCDWRHKGSSFGVILAHVAWPRASDPSKPKKRHFGHLFWTPADKSFENRHLHFLDAIFFTGENFTKLNLNIFSKMYGTCFHNWSRFQVTAYRKFRRSLGILRLQGL